MPRARKKPQKPKPMVVGDIGPLTQAQQSNVDFEDIKGDANGRKYKRRREQLDWMIYKAAPSQRISTRQWQAGIEIRNRYCAKEALSSGDELKEQVDKSPRPDGAVAAQIDAISALKEVMDLVPSNMLAVVEHVCHHNEPISSFPNPGAKAQLQVALDLVANGLRY